MEICVPYINQNYWDSLSNEYQNDVDEDEIQYSNVTAKVYERSRIKALADEREIVQKKTFTKWINSSLIHISMKIEDLYVDLRDGKYLLALLEILSNEPVPKPTRGRMRIHCLENVDKCLGFLFNQKVHLENVGAHDIVDGNPRLTLGLIWTIILRFQVQDIQFDEDYSLVAKSAKDALLLWCQMKTAGYPSVNIKNFTNSWRTGLGFVALIHKHRPDLIDFSSCNRNDNISNLQLAFNVAENSLGITSLLDPEDVNVPLPDERSVITYVASYYHYFNTLKASNVLNKRINKILNQLMEDEQMIQLYQSLVTKLLQWIQNTIRLLNVHQFANSIPGVQEQMNVFNSYRTKEKPNKFIEKVDLEVLLYTIKSNQLASRLRIYNPPEDFSLAIINNAWDKLNSSEYEREMALRKELMRQERLRNLAQKFLKKVSLRESWITDNLELLSKQSLGTNLPTILAALKKHEAIETDIYAYEENLTGLTKIFDQLKNENYNEINVISVAKNKVNDLWKKLLHTLHERREHLDNHLQIYNLLNDFNDIQLNISGLTSLLKVEYYGKHLLEVEELIRAHEIIESDIRLINQRMEKLVLESERYLRYCDKDFRGNNSINKTTIKDKRNSVIKDFQDLLVISGERKSILKHSHLVWQFIADVSSEEQWIKELLNIMSNPDLGNDLTSVDRLLKKHRVIEAELVTKRIALEKKLLEGKTLIEKCSVGHNLIASKNNDIQVLWEALIDATENRKIKLLEMLDFYQFISDCDDTECWIEEFKKFFDLKHLGDKMSYTEILIKKNQTNMEIIEGRRENIDQLHALAESLMSYSIINQLAVSSKLEKVKQKYENLLELAHKMQEKLIDTLTVFRLLNDADSVKTWITEKEKFLANFVPCDDIEELEILKHRFEVFESDLTKRAEKVYHVNMLSENLVTNGNPNQKIIIANQDDLNNCWNKMADVVDSKREELLSTYHYTNFFLDCQQTLDWIKEKMQVLESIDQLGDDLDSVIQRQRRINHLQRDICAIEAKINHLVSQGELIIRSNLGNAKDIEHHLNVVHMNWEKLHQMIMERDSTLTNKNDLYRFLEKLDDFQFWLGPMQTEMATQNIPESLKEVEHMINEYNLQRDEMLNKEQELNDFLTIGDDYLKSDDKSEQYVRLANRLKGLRNGWKILVDLSEEKEKRLENYLKSFMFFEDARQIENLLSSHERFLMRDIKSVINAVNASKSNLLSLHEIVNDNNAYIQKMESDVNILHSVLEQGRLLVSENNFHKDKIAAKCQNLEERWIKNQNDARKRKKDLEDQVVLFELLQDIDDLDDSLLEKIQLLSEITHHVKTIESCLAQCKALEEELGPYKIAVDDLNKRAKQTIKKYPQFETDINSHLDNLNATWNELTKSLDEKLQVLAHKNRETAFEESTQSMLKRLEDIENQMVTDDDPNDVRSGITSVDNHLKKLDSHNKELENQKRLLDDLKDHSEYLKKHHPDKALQYEEVEKQVKVIINNLSAPLENKLSIANQKKKDEQFLQDCNDEIDWIKEKLDLVSLRSKQMDAICTLQHFQQLQMRHKSVKTEVGNRAPKIKLLLEEGERMIENDHSKKDIIDETVKKLKDIFEKLNQEIDKFQKQLSNQLLIQEFLLDVSEISTWISEKELDLMNIIITAKDDQQIRRIARKQKTLEIEIKNYFSNIDAVRKACRNLPSQYRDILKDAENNYISLKIICTEKRTEISLFVIYCETFELFQNIELWIIEKTKIARNDDSGRDLDQCTLLRDRFAIFASETNKIGTLKIMETNKKFDDLIQGKHPFAHSISIWKDRINEIWADLLELIDTRTQLLKSAWDLHMWFCDCQFLIECIEEKKSSIQIINELGKDPKSVLLLQRKLKNFEKDLSRMDSDINNAVIALDKLLPLYSKDKEERLIKKRTELIECFKQLRKLLEDRKLNNLELADYHNFMSMVRELIQWIEKINIEMEMRHKPRDVSGIELLLSNHRSLKIGMDSKEENFSICLNLGRTLLRTKHIRSSEIKAKCREITEKRDILFKKWYNILDHLSIMVEVYQWARDAALAEAWVISQESYLNNENLGMTLDETLALLKKIILFQKTNLSQEEKFEQLKRLTTLEIRSQKLNEDRKSINAASIMVEKPVKHEVKHEEEMVIPRSQKTQAMEYMHKAPKAPESNQNIRRCSSIDSCLDNEIDTKDFNYFNQGTSRSRVNRPLTQNFALSPVPQVRPTKRPQPSHLAKPSQNLSASTDTLSIASKAPRPIQPEDVTIKGALYRKHQWENRNQKASNRTWHSMYVLISQSRMTFFKDERHYKEKPGQYYKHEMPLILCEVVAAPAHDYTKRPCVFRVRFRNGAEFLFQGSSVVDMTRWIEAINNASRPLRPSIPNPTGSTSNLISTTQSHPNLSSSMPPQSHQPRGLKRFLSSIRLKK